MKIATAQTAYNAVSCSRGNTQSVPGEINASDKAKTSTKSSSGKLQSRQVHDLKKMAANIGKETIGEKTVWQGNSKTSTINSLQSYSDTLRSNRSKTKDTTNSLKTLKYQYKNISSKILRSKTSANAKQVASQARREVLRLKRQKMSKDADLEELDAAITHAKSMERIAQKKARHLQEEEMAKAAMLNHPENEDDVSAVSSVSFASDNGYTDDSGLDETESAEYSSGEENYENEIAFEDGAGEEISAQLAAKYDAMYEVADAAMYEGFDAAMYESSDAAMYEGFDAAMYEVANAAMYEGFDSAMVESSDAAMADMIELLDDFDESMQELMEEMGLDELMDTFETIKKDLTPEELKEITIKHRNKEMKDIVKADADYLKVVFDKIPTPTVDITV